MVDKRTCLVALIQKKEEEKKALEASIRALKEELRESFGIKCPGIDWLLEKRDLLIRIAGKDRSYQDAQKFCASLISLLTIGEMKIVGLGSLVTIEDQGQCRTCLIIPNGGGCSLQMEGQKIFCLSAQSPLGQALIGKTMMESLLCNNRTFRVLQVQ